MSEARRGSVPVLQMIADHDPFMPAHCRNEMRDDFGERIKTQAG